MITNWKIRFVDGTDAVEPAVTIDEAIKEAEFKYGKSVRSAMFHSSFTDIQVSNEFGLGYGPTGAIA